MKLQDIDNDALYITMGLFLVCFVILAAVVVAVCVVVHFWEAGCRWPAWLGLVLLLVGLFAACYATLKGLRPGGPH